jgi:hypothetical protein
MHRSDEDSATGFHAKGIEPRLEFSGTLIVVCDTRSTAGCRYILSQNTRKLDRERFSFATPRAR